MNSGYFGFCGEACLVSLFSTEKYKLVVLVYWCIRGLAMAYLVDTLQPVAQNLGQQLHSSSTSALAVSPTRLCTIGDRSK